MDSDETESLLVSDRKCDERLVVVCSIVAITACILFVVFWII